jgi:hypothetical protein
MSPCANLCDSSQAAPFGSSVIHLETSALVPCPSSSGLVWLEGIENVVLVSYPWVILFSGVFKTISPVVLKTYPASPKAKKVEDITGMGYFPARFSPKLVLEKLAS